MGFRIPVIDGPSVDSRPQQSPGLYVPQQSDAVAQAVDRTGAEVGQAVDQYVARAAQAKAKADALQEANATTALEREFNAQLYGISGADGSRTPGFLETQGLSASENSAATIEGLAKARQKIAESLANDEQRSSFLARSDQMLVGAQRTVESHTAQQFRVAQAASAQALQAQTLEGVFNAPDDLATPIRSAAVESSLRALAPSPEAADAAVAKWRSTLAATQIDRELNGNDFASADKLYEEKHDDLGLLRDNVAARIASAKKAAATAGANAQAELAVEGILGKSRNEDGYVDEAKARAALEAVPETERTRVRTLLNAQLTEESKRLEYDNKQRRLQALELERKQGLGAVLSDRKLVEGFDKYDGEFLHRMLNEADLKWRRAQAAKNNDAGARREQAALDATALNEYQALGQQEMADTDPEDFATGRGMSEVAKSKLKVLHTKAGGAVTKGYAHDLDKTVDDANKDAAPLFVSKGKTKAPFANDPAAKEAYDARVTEEFRKFYDEKKRAPTDAERLAITSKIGRAHV